MTVTISACPFVYFKNVFVCLYFCVTLGTDQVMQLYQLMPKFNLVNLVKCQAMKAYNQGYYN